MLRTKLYFALVFLIVGISSMALCQQAPQRALIMLSIDGLSPDYLNRADEYKLKIPHLRKLLEVGAHASGVRGVLPTVTYPSHTTMLTGVWPTKHGIYSNLTFDPLAKNQGGWYWYSEDIRVPTLWESAAKAGYTVGSISWPVSIGAPGVSYLIPEFWRAMTPEDLKLLSAISTPGLIKEMQKTVGQYTTDLDDAVPGDWLRTRYAEALISQKHVRFLTFHFAALDHLEHAHGAFTPVAFETLEEIDKMVGVLATAIRKEDPNAIVCIVSDHGFANIDHQFNLAEAFVKAGLITLKSPKSSLQASGVADWKAMPWMNSGSAAIVLRDPKDESTRVKVKALLQSLAADPQNGIAQILDEKAIAELGGTPAAAFFVDMKPGFSVGSGLGGPLVSPISSRGTHGFSPTHPEMRASFVIAGPGIRKGVNIGDIDMRSVAPTVAKVLGVSFPTADLPPLDIFNAN